MAKTSRKYATGAGRRGRGDVSTWPVPDVIGLTVPLPAAARRLCLLSNGSYSVMLSDSGAGFSRWRDLATTRWREDATRDQWGSHLLLRDSTAAWCGRPTTRQPLGAKARDVTVTFAQGGAEFVRHEGSLTSTLHVAVAPDADIELRRVTLTNHGDTFRALSLTPYPELVLGAVAADNAHSAFSKMFVQTAWEAQHGGLLATRRKRAKGETEMWAAQALQVEGVNSESGQKKGALEHETDRARFLGRRRTLNDVQAMQPGASLRALVRPLSSEQVVRCIPPSWFPALQ